MYRRIVESFKKQALKPTDPKKHDPKKLAEGAKVESEHTKHPEIAETISSHHLSEDPQYSKKLKIMERVNLSDMKSIGKAEQDQPILEQHLADQIKLNPKMSVNKLKQIIANPLSGNLVKNAILSAGVEIPHDALVEVAKKFELTPEEIKSIHRHNPGAAAEAEKWGARVRPTLYSEKLREMRHLVKESQTQALSKRDMIRHGLDPRALGVAHLQDAKGLIHHADLDKHVDNLPKFEYNFTEGQYGTDADKDIEAERERIRTEGQRLMSRSVQVQNIVDPHEKAAKVNELVRDYVEKNPVDEEYFREQARSTAEGEQRHNSEPSNVFQLNITPRHEQALKQGGLWDSFQKAKKATDSSMHPVHDRTLGWVRHTGNPQTGIHIEEVQSDLGRALEDKDTKLIQAGIPREHIQPLHNILFGGHDANAVTHSAFLQHLRDKDQAGTKLHIWKQHSAGELHGQKAYERVNTGHIRDDLKPTETPRALTEYALKHKLMDGSNLKKHLISNPEVHKSFENYLWKDRDGQKMLLSGYASHGYPNLKIYAKAHGIELTDNDYVNSSVVKKHLESNPDVEKIYNIKIPQTLPVTTSETYDVQPKKMNYKDSTYGEIPTQDNDKHLGKETWTHTLRKTEELELMEKGEKDILAHYPKEMHEKVKPVVKWTQENLPSTQAQTWFAANHARDPKIFKKHKEKLEQYGKLMGSGTEIGNKLKAHPFNKQMGIEEGLSVMKTHAAEHVKNLKSRNALEPRKTTTKIMDMGDDFKDWAWFDLHAEHDGTDSHKTEAKKKNSEGHNMGHCGNFSGMRAEGDNILSFRKVHPIPGGKELHEPHVTFIQNGPYVGEMKGRGNKKPTKEYHRPIVDLLKKHPDIHYAIGGGYAPEQNFDINDLSPELKEELFKAKPTMDLANNFHKLDPKKVPSNRHEFKENLENWQTMRKRYGKEWAHKLLTKQVKPRGVDESELASTVLDFPGVKPETLHELVTKGDAWIKDHNKISSHPNLSADSLHHIFTNRDEYTSEFLDQASRHKNLGEKTIDHIIGHADVDPEEFIAPEYLSNAIKHRNVSIDTMKKIFTDPKLKHLREIALQHKGLPAELLKHVVENEKEHTLVRAAVKHNRATPDILDLAKTHPDTEVREGVASHAKASPAILDHIVKNDPDGDVRYSALSNERTLPATLEHAAKFDKDASNRRRSLGSTKLNEKQRIGILDHLIRNHEDSGQRATAVRHEFAPEATVVHAAMNDKDPLVRNAAINTYKLSKEHLDHIVKNDTSPEVRAEALDVHDQWSPETLHHLITKDADPEVRSRALSKSSLLPESVNHAALNDPEDRNRSVAIQHAHATPETIDKVVKNDTSDDVREAGVGNKNASASTLAHALMHDKSADVRKATTNHDSTPAEALEHAIFNDPDPGVQEEAAKGSNLTPELLSKMMGTKDKPSPLSPRIKVFAATDQNLPAETANEALLDGGHHQDVHKRLLRRQDITPETLHHVIENHPIADVRRSALNHDNIVPRTLAHAAMYDKETQVRYEAVTDENTPAKAIDHAAMNDPDSSVKRRAVDHKNISAEALNHVVANDSEVSVRRKALDVDAKRTEKALTPETLTKAVKEDTDPQNRRVALAHPLAPKSLVDHMVIHDLDPINREHAIEQHGMDITSEAVDHAAQFDKNDLVRLAAIKRNSRMSVEVAKKIALSDDKFRGWATVHPDMPADALDQILDKHAHDDAQNINQDVRGAIAKHKNTSPETLTKILRSDVGARNRQLAIENPNVPQDELKRVAREDGSLDVAGSLIDNPNLPADILDSIIQKHITPESGIPRQLRGIYDHKNLSAKAIHHLVQQDPDSYDTKALLRRGDLDKETLGHVIRNSTDARITRPALEHSKTTPEMLHWAVHNLPQEHFDEVAFAIADNDNTKPETLDTILRKTTHYRTVANILSKDNLSPETLDWAARNKTDEDDQEAVINHKKVTPKILDYLRDSGSTDNIKQLAADKMKEEYPDWTPFNPDQTVMPL